MKRTVLACGLVVACSSGGGAPQPEGTPTPTERAEPAPARPAGDWRIPDGWRSEVIPFPLEFAPSIQHTGVEELRFAPGFFDPQSPGYWSYAFAWRTDDAARLDAAALGTELTAYFRGLVDAVDEKNEIQNLDAIVATAKPDPAADSVERYVVTAKVIDAFKTKRPVELTGWAQRDTCGSGALWIVVLAPPTSGVVAELAALAREVRCGQKPR